MRSPFHAFLPNGQFGDPALWIDAPDLGRSFLFDLGELHRVPPRKLLKVERIVVSHTHMDHFIGFDHLLRRVLGRERTLTLTGPPGFVDQVRSRMGAYTWNLVEGCPVVLIAEETDGEPGSELRSMRFDAGNRMRGEELPCRPFTGVIDAGRGYRLSVAAFDHGIPILGARLEESEHLAVNGDALRRKGLLPGPWLAELKQRIRAGAPEGVIEALTQEGATRGLSSSEIAGELITRHPGRAIAYVADLAGSEENRQRLIEWARGVDLLVCEAAFLEEDSGLAAERGHLTARQAGSFARDAGVGRLALFHFSPRYQGRSAELLEEAAMAFGNEIVELPEGPTV